MSCQECGNNRGYKRKILDKMLCADCNMLDKYILITKTAAKKEYLLKDSDLEKLNEYTGECRRGMATFYLKEQVMVLACMKQNIMLEVVDNQIIAKRESRKKKKEELMEKRKKELNDELKSVGLRLRSDSVLCEKYINGDKTYSLDWIVNRMCEMKYLFDYCHMAECKNKVYRKYKEMNEHCPYDFIFDEAEELALKKYSNGRYPEMFPWLDKKVIDV